ncbi:MAG: ABC transporter ATP-binding protein, partial [Lachnospiraceae bacterium]|nr:ABC transporter ATP-binding protein [Lachnospiraceae bacterium]
MARPRDYKNAGRKARDPKKTLLRLLSYLKRYLPILVIALVCVVVTAFAQTMTSAALGTLVDDYILPMVDSGKADFSQMGHYLIRVGAVLVAGIFCSWLYNFLMVGVSQGTQKTIRDEMFSKMQKLPLRYFDTNTAGNIMSRYTSDIDTLRQMISQSIPQAASSIITLLVVSVRLITTSWVLSLVMVVTVFGIVQVTKFVIGRAGGYFIEQQRSLGALNGHVEEMINGQKVVKVFNHENASKEQFDELNETLCRNAYNAGRFSNSMGPVNNNLGYIQYAILAVAGGMLVVLTKGSALTLGKLMTFMILSRSFNMPISQISNQINSIVLALAGAERIFDLMDEQPETDEGCVTLVDAVIDEDGTVHEADHHTGHWAWKHPHQADGTVTYTPLMGDITMDHVDFSYVPEKPVLHDITLFAEPGQKLAFVGATGAGKTTITNLINRFYDIEDGKIRYDGI